MSSSLLICLKSSFMNSSIFRSSSLVHWVVAPLGDPFRIYPPFLDVDLLLLTYVYFFFILSSYSFFSLAILASSSLLRIVLCDPCDLSLFYEEAWEILLMPDLLSSILELLCYVAGFGGFGRQLIPDLASYLVFWGKLAMLVESFSK